MVKNTQHRIAAAWFFVAILGLVIIIAVPLLDLDIFRGGGAAIAFGFVAMITGIVAGAIYRGRAQGLNYVLTGRDVLAEWTYDPLTWQRFSEAEHHARKREIGRLFGTFFVMVLVVCTFMSFVVGKNRWIILVVFAALTPVIGIAAFLNVWLPYRRNLGGADRAVISRDGVYFAGEFHSWGGAFVRFESAVITEQSAPGIEPVDVLAITYSMWVSRGRQSHTVRIPIPDGHDEEARRIVRELQAQMAPN